MPKSILVSKTALLNAVGTVIAVVTVLQQQPWVVTYPKVAAGLAAAYALANVVLRLVTKEPVTLSLPW